MKKFNLNRFKIFIQNDEFDGKKISYIMIVDLFTGKQYGVLKALLHHPGALCEAMKYLIKSMENMTPAAKEEAEKIQLKTQNKVAQYIGFNTFLGIPQVTGKCPELKMSDALLGGLAKAGLLQSIKPATAAKIVMETIVSDDPKKFNQGLYYQKLIEKSVENHENCTERFAHEEPTELNHPWREIYEALYEGWYFYNMVPGSIQEYVKIFLESRITSGKERGELVGLIPAPYERDVRKDDFRHLYDDPNDPLSRFDNSLEPDWLEEIRSDNPINDRPGYQDAGILALLVARAINAPRMILATLRSLIPLAPEQEYLYKEVLAGWAPALLEEYNSSKELNKIWKAAGAPEEFHAIARIMRDHYSLLDRDQKGVLELLESSFKMTKAKATYRKIGRLVKSDNKSLELSPVEGKRIVWDHTKKLSYGKQLTFQRDKLKEILHNPEAKVYPSISKALCAGKGYGLKGWLCDQPELIEEIEISEEALEIISELKRVAAEALDTTDELLEAARQEKLTAANDAAEAYKTTSLMEVNKDGEEYCLADYRSYVDWLLRQ